MLKKGVTMIALVTTMIIMTVLVSVVSISGYSMMNNSKKINLATELAMIQEAINNYYSKTNGDYPVSDSVILDVTNVTEKSKLQFDIEDIVDNKIMLEKIDYSKIGLKTLNYGNLKYGKNDIYVLSSKTGIVYYAKGLSINDYTYYTLNDELKKMINYTTNDSNILNKDGILFIPSTRKITNNDVSLVIKVPNNYVVDNVKSEFNFIETKEENYNIYTINGINKNTEISVNYTLNGNKITANFNVDNIDKEIPKVVVDSKQEVFISSDDKKAFVNFKVESDDIKIIKYEIDKIPEDKIVSYFAGNGIKLYKNTLPITKGVKNLTLYVLDKAGNYVAKYIKVDDDVYNKLNGNGE